MMLAFNKQHMLVLLCVGVIYSIFNIYSINSAATGTQHHEHHALHDVKIDQHPKNAHIDGNHTRDEIRGRDEENTSQRTVTNQESMSSSTTSSTTSTSTSTTSTISNNPALLDSNSSQYTWTGNHFIPPRGIPTFSPIDFLAHFQKRNTLYIGDSTGRRAYATLYGAMNSSDVSNIPVVDLDSGSVIDFNKKGQRKERCGISDRGLFRLNSSSFVCRQLFHSSSEDFGSSNDAANATNATIISNDISTTTTRSGKFDYLPEACMKELISLFSNANADLFQDYDLIVINVGIWEGIRRRDCRMFVNSTAVDEFGNITVTPRSLANAEKYDLALDALAAASSPNLQIAFRTPGFEQNQDGDRVMWELVNHIKQYSTTNTPTMTQQSTNNETTPEDGTNKKTNDNQKRHSTNITVVDWGTVISKRSYGNERIAGDMKPHYGLEARLLFAQQLLHELLAAEQRQKIVMEEMDDDDGNV